MGKRSEQRRLIEDYLGQRARLYAEEKAILADVLPPGPLAWEDEEALDELASLARTAGVMVVARLVQRRNRPDPSTFLGKGKSEELAQLAAEHDAQVAVMGSELSPAQARNLEQTSGLKVVDRSQVILDIFAQRAGTREAELSVELAQLEYLLPRLRGWGAALTDPGGGIGTRGPGETRLETDRRHAQRRIQSIRRQLKEMDRIRRVRREKRRGSGTPEVAIIGYTNSGKSTLFRRLTGADSFIEDKLFATLDTRVRRLELPGGGRPVAADTVGFIRKLPHQLVPAFQATMESTREASLLLNVLDASSVHLLEHYATVREVLAEQMLGDEEPWPPVLHVLNKLDEVRTPEQKALLQRARLEIHPQVCLSAKTGQGLDRLRERMAQMLDPAFARVLVRIPWDRQDLLSWLAELGKLEVLPDPQALRARVTVPASQLPRIRTVSAITVLEPSA
ncbi:MAG: GTPase HflX [Candidatus Bipolaricaulota bacterium]